ncbi:MAG: IS110 family transposase [Rubrobacteraceae bacterium]|nr:IS110 family transposase [Rubrobacteraceae bacterium]
MDRVIERCCGLDVHKASVTACLRVPGEAGEPHQEIREFAATTPGLLQLRDWLASFGIELVGMEATGVYWKPIYYLLEDDFECWLLNAHHLKNVPGRKTDIKDAEWICQLLEHGLVRPSFVPPKEIRELRNLTRYRKTQVEERTREVQRLEKILQEAGIKLSSVASRVLGASGRVMLDALVEGTTDPEVLAELARGRLRSKLPTLREALQGRFSSHHALMVGKMLAHIDYLDESIAELSTEVERVIAPFSYEVELLDTIPGVNRKLAETIIAEIGVQMSQFPTHRHLASWAGMCPGNDESAGKRRSGKTRKGSKWLRSALVEAAHAASRSKGTHLSAQYARLRGRRGPKKAAVAVGHSILVIAYHILEREVPYEELGEDHFDQRRSNEAYTKRLVRQLERLGHQVALEPLSQPA